VFQKPTAHDLARVERRDRWHQHEETKHYPENAIQIEFQRGLDSSEEHRNRFTEAVQNAYQHRGQGPSTSHFNMQMQPQAATNLKGENEEEATGCYADSEVLFGNYFEDGNCAHSKFANQN